MMSSIVKNSFIRFIAVGILNTVIGTAIMLGLYNLAGCSYWFSSAANYVIVSVLSYFLNRKFTFGYEGKLLGGGIRFAVNIAVCYVAAYGIARPLAAYALAEYGVTARDNVAMLVGMCIFTVFNYLGQKFFVFSKNR